MECDRAMGVFVIICPFVEIKSNSALGFANASNALFFISLESPGSSSSPHLTTTLTILHSLFTVSSSFTLSAAYFASRSFNF